MVFCATIAHSAKNMDKLERMVKQAAKSIYVTPLRSLHCYCMTKKTGNILHGATHPLHATFIPTRSGRWYLSISAHTARYSRSFVPSAIRALNSRLLSYRGVCANYRTIYVHVLAGCLHKVEYFSCRFLYYVFLTPCCSFIKCISMFLDQ